MFHPCPCLTTPVAFPHLQARKSLFLTQSIGEMSHRGFFIWHTEDFLNLVFLQYLYILLNFTYYISSFFHSAAYVFFIKSLFPSFILWTLLIVILWVLCLGFHFTPSLDAIIIVLVILGGVTFSCLLYYRTYCMGLIIQLGLFLSLRFQKKQLYLLCPIWVGWGEVQVYSSENSSLRELGVGSILPE